MNVKASSSAEIFRLAVSAIVDRMPHGSQKTIAKVLGVREGYLSDLIKGKRNWSDRLRDKFAQAVGMSVSEIYAIGEGIDRTGTFFPYSPQVSSSLPNSPDRAAIIFRCAMKELKIHGEAMAKPEVLAAINSDSFNSYISGRINDGEYYKHVVSRLKQALVHYTLKK